MFPLKRSFCCKLISRGQGWKYVCVQMSIHEQIHLFTFTHWCVYLCVHMHACVLLFIIMFMVAAHYYAQLLPLCLIVVAQVDSFSPCNPKPMWILFQYPEIKHLIVFALLVFSHGCPFSKASHGGLEFCECGSLFSIY